MSAMREAEDLRAKAVAAAALFKPALGGWIVQIFPGGIRQRPACENQRAATRVHNDDWR